MWAHAWFVWLIAGAGVAHADPKIVCPKNLVDVTGCDFFDLSDAVASGAKDIELREGRHTLLYPAWVFKPNTVITAEPGAELVDPGMVAIEVDPLAVDTAITGLTFVPHGGATTFSGGLIHVAADGTTLRDLSVVDVSSPLTAVQVDGAVGVRIEGGVFTDNLVSDSVIRVASGADVAIVDAVLTDNLPGWTTIHATDATLSLDGVTMTGGLGGIAYHIATTDTDLTLTDTVLELPNAGAGASLVDFNRGTLTIDGGHISSSDPVTWFGLGLINVRAARRVDVAGTVFGDHQFRALYVANADALTVRDAVFGGTTSGSAVATSNVDTVEVSDTWFCGQVGPFGPALDLVGSCADGCTLDRSVVADSSATDAGVVRIDAGELAVTNTTFVANQGVNDGGAVFAEGAGKLALVRSIVVDNLGTGAAVSGELTAFTDNAFGNNRANDLSGPWPEPDVNLRPAAPVFVAEAGDPCVSPVRLADAPANQWLVEHRSGRFTPCRTDADADGFGAGWLSDGSLGCDQPGETLTAGDCDDADPNTFPDADDAWYDGIDSDCAGDDDFDQDGDGIPAEDDCDELRTDCGDPPPDRRLLGGACAGCSTGGAGSLWLGFALAPWLRRVRRIRSV